jgi:stage VI sporulation protein D
MWMGWREESKVTDERSGLRFDIYERVHLSEDAVSIRELDEIELVPRIRVDNDSEQAVLTGSLVLSGIYQGEDEHSSHRLEHRIPVEITLPIHRIHRIEEISVEIENFDVDLISARSMNITGVLSLRGIELAGAEEEKDWKEEEEIVFVHRADEGAAAEPATEAVNEASNEVVVEPGIVSALSREPEPELAVRSEANDVSVEAGEEATLEQAQPEAATVNRSESIPESAAAVHEVGAVNQAEAAEEAAEVADAGESETEQVAVQEIELSSESVSIADDSAAAQKQDVKIAFSGKKPDSAEDTNKFKSALHKLLNRESQDGGAGDKQRAASEEQAEEQTRSPDSLEWKRLFLGGSSNDGEFRRLRMCIVQKEESIDTIAERYQLNPREIILYNRLGDGQLSEGQIIYIPK